MAPFTAMAQWKVRLLRRVRVRPGAPVYLLFARARKLMLDYMRACVYYKIMPAIKLRRVSQGKLIPSTLNCLACQGVNRRHVDSRIPFALPSLRQGHASPSHVIVEDFDVASLIKTFASQMPCEAEVRFLRDVIAFFRWSLIPSTNTSSSK